MTPLHDLRKQLEFYLVGILVLIAITYGLFRAYPLLAGPNITVHSPKDGENVASTTFQISGTVLRAKEITIQGRPITTDTDGKFNETLVPQYPYTLIILEAKDSYGNTKTKNLRVVPK